MRSLRLVTVTEIGIDWDALEDRTTHPLDRARAAMKLLGQIPGIQERLALIRGNAIAELRDIEGSSAKVAELLGVSPARVGQLIGDGGRPDGVRLGLLRKGLTLALQYGNLLPGDDAKVMQALAALGRPGRRTEVEARGIATRLATIRGSMLNWDDMSTEDKETLMRAFGHAGDVMHSRPRAKR